MPLYEFSCNACQHRFTVLLAYKEKNSCACPECGGKDIIEHLGGFSSPTSSPGASPGPGCGCGSPGTGPG